MKHFGIKPVLWIYILIFLFNCIGKHIFRCIYNVVTGYIHNCRSVFIIIAVMALMFRRLFSRFLSFDDVDIVFSYQYNNGINAESNDKNCFNI